MLQCVIGFFGVSSSLTGGLKCLFECVTGCFVIS